MMNTPTARIIEESLKLTTVTDQTGRQLTLRRISALDRLRLFKAVGPELAQNFSYLGLALLAISVVEIDGVPVPSPVTEAQLEGLVQRLGDEGLAAVSDTFPEDATDGEEMKSGN